MGASRRAKEASRAGQAVHGQQGKPVQAVGGRPRRHRRHRLEGSCRGAPGRRRESSAAGAGEALRPGPWALLLIFQAMDAAGKDSTIKHVMSGVNPQGCQVYSFKAPSSEELDHDFLWRTTRCLPERGRIGIFNRSYYEEVLVVRVHPEMLAAQQLPAGARHEAHLEGALRGHQRLRALPRRATASSSASSSCTCRRRSSSERFLERLDEPEKNWKFSVGRRRRSAKHWDDYMARLRGHDPAHGDARRAVVRRARPTTSGSRGSSSPRRSSDAMSKLDLKFPDVDRAKRRELEAVRAALMRERV